LLLLIANIKLLTIHTLVVKLNFVNGVSCIIKPIIGVSICFMLYVTENHVIRWYLTQYPSISYLNIPAYHISISQHIIPQYPSISYLNIPAYHTSISQHIIPQYPSISYLYIPAYHTSISQHIIPQYLSISYLYIPAYHTSISQHITSSYLTHNST